VLADCGERGPEKGGEARRATLWRRGTVTAKARERGRGKREGHVYNAALRFEGYTFSCGAAASAWSTVSLSNAHKHTQKRNLCI
jgi:hypothetical protein